MHKITVFLLCTPTLWNIYIICSPGACPHWCLEEACQLCSVSACSNEENRDDIVFTVDGVSSVMCLWQSCGGGKGGSNGSCCSINSSSSSISSRCVFSSLILCKKPFGEGAMDDGGRLRI